MKPTYAIENIDTQQIDPSPFQKRKHFVKEKLQDLAASIENDDPVNRVNTLLGKLNSVVNNQNKQSTISESRLQQVHKFMNPMKKIFKNLPKRLEWKCFYVNDLPIIMEICEDIRQISLENQLNKSQIKAISEVKKISAKAFQDIVNIGKIEKSSQHDSQKNDLKKASNVPLQEMSAREIKPNERLAHWASSVSSVHTSLAIERAENAVIDTIAYMLIGLSIRLLSVSWPLCFSGGMEIRPLSVVSIKQPRHGPPWLMKTQPMPLTLMITMKRQVSPTPARLFCLHYWPLRKNKISPDQTCIHCWGKGYAEI